MSAESSTERFVLHGHGLSGGSRAAVDTCAGLARRLAAFHLSRSRLMILPARATVPAVDLSALEPTVAATEDIGIHESPLQTRARRAEQLPVSIATSRSFIADLGATGDVQQTTRVMEESAPPISTSTTPQAADSADIMSPGNRIAHTEPAGTHRVTHDREVEHVERRIDAVTTSSGSSVEQHLSARIEVDRVPSPFMAEVQPVVEPQAPPDLTTPRRAPWLETPANTATRVPLERPQSVAPGEIPTPRLSDEARSESTRETSRVVYMGPSAATAPPIVHEVIVPRHETLTRLAALQTVTTREETLRIDNVQVVVHSAANPRQAPISPVAPPVQPRMEPTPPSEFHNPWRSNRHRYD